MLESMERAGARGGKRITAKTILPRSKVDTSGTPAPISVREDQYVKKIKREAQIVDNISVSKRRGEYKEFSTWAEAEMSLYNLQEGHSLEKRAAQATFPGMGQNKILASWLYSHQDTQSPNLKKALMGAIDGTAWYLNDATMGVGIHNPPYIRGGGNAVNPAFRTAVIRHATELQWSGSSVEKLREQETLAAKFTESYRSIAPNGGTYANEVSFCLSLMLMKIKLTDL